MRIRAIKNCVLRLNLSVGMFASLVAFFPMDSASGQNSKVVCDCTCTSSRGLILCPQRWRGTAPGYSCGYPAVRSETVSGCLWTCPEAFNPEPVNGACPSGRCRGWKHPLGPDGPGEDTGGNLVCTGTVVVPINPSNPGSQTGDSGTKPPSITDSLNKAIIDAYKKPSSGK